MFRAQAFALGQVQCPYTGKRLEQKRSHVHHRGSSFLQVADEFLVANAAHWQHFDTKAAGQVGYRLSDRQLAERWVFYHGQMAELEVVSPEANLSFGANGYEMTFSEPTV